MWVANASKRQVERFLTVARAIALVGVGCCGLGMAEDKEKPKGPEAVPVVPGAAEGVNFERDLSFDLTPEQMASFKAKLPKAFQKLSQRKPFHVVAMGDSIVEMFGYDEDDQNWIKGYPARFAEQLARQFFYTGGVRLIKPSMGTE